MYIYIYRFIYEMPGPIFRALAVSFRECSCYMIHDRVCLNRKVWNVAIQQTQPFGSR